MRPKITAVILAAGRGERAGKGLPKQFVSVLGSPLFIYSVKAFLSAGVVDEIIVLVPRGWVVYSEKELKRLRGNKPVKVFTGGHRRQDSVYKGLLHISEDMEYVVIHDAVRPLVTPGLIVRTVEGALTCGACVPVVMPPDTVKEVGRGVIKRTIPRERIGLTQTPQAFSCKILRKVYQKGPPRRPVTDDAQLIEVIGKRIKAIPGERMNFKVTWREDFCVLEAHLKRSTRF